MTTLESITATRTRAWPLLLARIALRTGTALVPLLAMFLVARRLAGALEALSGVLLVVVGLIAVAAVVLWRHLWRRLEGDSRSSDAVQRFLPPATLAMLAVALSIGGTHPLALMMFWAVLVGEEVWAGLQREPEVPETARAADPHPNPLPQGEGAGEEEETHELLLPPGVSQQITRTADAQGETLDCLLRVNFAQGEQTKVVHVAFCPPLLFAPTATAEHVDGADCEVKITASEVFGARLEVKRRGALALEDEAIVALHVVAREELQGA